MNTPQTDAENEREADTIPEFARRLGIPRSTAYELAKRNQLPVPVIRVGRRVLVSRVLVDRLLAGEPVYPIINQEADAA